MRKKMRNRLWRRITAIGISLVLATGMLLGSNPVEVKAAGFTCSATLELNLVGYEGEGTPEFGEVFLRLYDNRDDDTSYVDIESDRLTVGGSGTNLQYSYVFEGGIYYHLAWYCRCPGGQEMYLNNHMNGEGYGNLGDTEDEISNLDKTIYRIRFMDGDGIYHEQYAGYGHNLTIKNNDPVKEQHTFRGWSEEKDSTATVNYSRLFSPGTIFREPATYYAVWRHPAEDTWAWNSDDGSHWHECSCGELKTEAEAHNWDAGVVTRQPTDTLEGEKTYTCNDCGKVKTELIPATGGGHVHDYGTEWKNDADNHWHECSCGDKADIAVHIEDNGRVTKEPTATENGIKTYLCKECGYMMRTEVLPATGMPAVSGNDAVSGNNPPNPDTPDTDDTPESPDVPGNNNSPANSDTNTNISQGGGENPVNTSVNTTAAAGKSKEPKTGRAPYVEIYATVAMIAGMAYLLLYFNDGERGMSEEEKRELVARLIGWAKKGGFFRRIVTLAVIFFVLVYYHCIGKKSYVKWNAVCEK